MIAATRMHRNKHSNIPGGGERDRVGRDGRDCPLFGRVSCIQHSIGEKSDPTHFQNNLVDHRVS